MRRRQRRVVECRRWRDRNRGLRVRVGGVDTGKLPSVSFTEAASVRSVQVGRRRFTERESGVAGLPVVEGLLEVGPKGRSERRADVGLGLGGRNIGERRQSCNGCLRDQ